MHTRILLLALFSPIWVFAQNDCLDRYDMEAIYLRSELFQGVSFVKNGVSRPVGFAYRKLKPEFELTPRALPMFNKARKNAKISFVISIAGIAGVATGTLMAIRSVDQQGYLTNESQYRNGLNIMLISAISSAAIQIPLQVKARQQLDDAIWLRNREILGR